jgi:hypothetical protein
MLLDEEDEVIEIGNTLGEQTFTVLRATNINNKSNQYLTRCENKKLFFLTKELNDLYLNKNLIKLKYLYYECSHQIEDNIDIIYDKLRLFLKAEWNAKHDELYNLVRLSYSKK